MGGLAADGAQHPLLRAPAVPYAAVEESLEARYDLERVERSDEREQAIWQILVREKRHVSRAAYLVLAAECSSVRPSPRSYRVRAGEPPMPAPKQKHIGRRPPNASNAAG